MLGHPFAQFEVGQAYLNGSGGKKDYEESYAWFLISKENGNLLAQKGIDHINKKNLINKHRSNLVIQRANDIYAKTKSKKGFDFGDSSTIQ